MDLRTGNPSGFSSPPCPDLLLTPFSWVSKAKRSPFQPPCPSGPLLLPLFRAPQPSPMSAKDPKDRGRKRLSRPNRKTHWHRRQLACLALSDEGYTVTNGSHTTSQDGPYQPTDIIRELSDRNTVKLIVVDDETQDTFDHIRTDYIQKFLRDMDVMRPTPVMPPLVCLECREEHCHRFRAASAFAWTTGFPLDPAPHSQTRRKRRKKNRVKCTV